MVLIEEKRLPIFSILDQQIFPWMIMGDMLIYSRQTAIWTA